MAVKNSQSRLQLDIKQESDDLVRAVINEVTRYHAEKDIVLQLRAPSRIQMVRQEYPSIAILARCKNQDQVSAAIKAKVQFIELERWISRAAIDAAHAANIPVLLNIAHPSIDTEAAHRYFRSRGIDIIMTDHASDW
jgi:imidazolonepropionase-like amidohydrolase